MSPRLEPPCRECGGAGTDEYPALGLCRYCQGAGTRSAERQGRAFWDRLEKQAAEGHSSACRKFGDDSECPACGT